MIKLNNWFQVNARRPLSIAGTMVLVLWSSIVVISYLEVAESQRNNFAHLLNVTALAMTQKNRALIESILQSAQSQTKALSVSICLGTKPEISSRFDLDSCGGLNGIFTRTLKNEIPGFTNYYLAISYSSISIAIEKVALLFLGLALMAITIMILRKVQGKFIREFLVPLKDGVLGDKPLQILELEDLRKAHHNAQSAKANLAVADAIMGITKQVSHDVRSPLSALNLVVGSLTDLPEEKRLIMRNATQRINDIANSLLAQGKKTDLGQNSISSKSAVTQLIEPVMLVALLDAVLSEKRTQFREKMNIEILGELGCGYGLFANLNDVEFSRIISNLINNSVEAFSDAGRVTISISGDAKIIELVISDNGAGIPKEILSRLGEKGYTYGKKGPQSGSGLGVFHAKETVLGAGGNFKIISNVGKGTEITITLPRTKTPKWFVERIEMAPGSMLVSVDDDRSIHQVWGRLLNSAGQQFCDIKHMAFSSTDMFETWFRTVGAKSKLFLIDYEFVAQTTNGLDLIERLRITDRAILVTSRYDEQHIREKAASLGLRILPKSLASNVPLKVVLPLEKHDALELA